MNEELYIPEGTTFEEGLEIVEQWNEEHPEDCHSPYMGILDDCPTETQTVETQTVEDTTETIVVEPKSPHTEDTSQLYVGGLMVVMVVSFMLLCALLVGKMKGDKKDEQ